jgi:nitrogen fixation/metabolism regulation signal transduction histidine kinase
VSRWELKRIPFGIRMLVVFWLATLPALALASLWVLDAGLTLYARILIIVLLVTWTGFLVMRSYGSLKSHLRTIDNLLEALETEDYSLRASEQYGQDELGSLYARVNKLAESMQYKRVAESELLFLLGKVIEQIDVAITVFDSQQAIRMINPRCCELLSKQSAELVGKKISDTELANLPGEESLADFDFSGGSGKWNISWQEYREQGRPGKILYISDLKKVLAEQELKTWKNLIRVITHEVNNSLAPISSISQSLISMIQQATLSDEEIEKVVSVLEVIGQRSESLKTFISQYAQVARLPEPNKTDISLQTLLNKAKSMFEGQDFEIKGLTEPMQVSGDALQLEQLLINVLKNAVESYQGGKGRIEIDVGGNSRFITLTIRDEGLGITNPENLFTPFYTTKKGGSGVGLTLCRQILAMHGGTINLRNREDRQGAEATIRLPVLSGFGVTGLGSGL